MSIKKILLTGFAVVAFGSLAMAQGGQPNQPQRDGGGMKRPGGEMRGEQRGAGMRGGPGMMRGGGMSFERLNLTDAQKQQIQAIQERAKSAREANKTQFEEFGNLVRLKREGLLTSEQGTRLNALQVQMQTRMKTDMDKMHSDILAVLTPDQKTLFEQGRGGGDRDGKGMRDRMPGAGRSGGQMPPPNGAGAPPPSDN